MDGHQAGQEEMLVKVTVKEDSLEAIHRPGGSPADHRGCSKCRVALGAVMGLVIGALVTGFVLYFVIFTASCEQNDPPSVTTTVPTPIHPTTIQTSFRPTKSDEDGQYDIWTVDKAGAYLIYGWVKFSYITNETVALWQMLDGQNRNFQKKIVSETEIFFVCEYLLVKGMRIRMDSKSNFKDSLFHVYRLLNQAENRSHCL